MIEKRIVEAIPEEILGLARFDGKEKEMLEWIEEHYRFIYDHIGELSSVVFLSEDLHYKGIIAQSPKHADEVQVTMFHDEEAMGDTQQDKDKHQYSHWVYDLLYNSPSQPFVVEIY
jgi:hypothetical protein